MRDERLPAAAVGAVLARLVEQSLVQAADGRFHLLETLRTYAAERLPEPELLRLRGPACPRRRGPGRGAAVAAAAGVEPDCVAALSAMTADLHQAWDHAVRHDRDLAVELAAVIYDFAYQRQRLDLLDWGLQVDAWDMEHPLLSQALATAAAAAWAAGELDRAEEIARRGIRCTAAANQPASARTVGQAANLAMFGDFAEAVALFEESERRSRAEGRDLAALMCEVCVCRAMTYAGDAAGAGSGWRVAAAPPAAATRVRSPGRAR